MSRLVTDARAAFPEIVLDDATFLAFVDERLPQPRKDEEVPAADLYLACACARGDEKALAAFEKRHFSDVELALARAHGSGITADEVKQLLREKLFVKTKDAAPRIATYSGQGSLAAWFRVTATRLVLNLVTRTKEIVVDADRLLDLATPEADPELQHLKHRYRAEFKLAFADAIAGLSPRDRNVLRYAFGDGLGPDEIAAIYGVHRTTVGRWLADLRKALLSGVRTSMVARLKISRDEFESIMRLIQSRVDITLAPFG